MSVLEKSAGQTRKKGEQVREAAAGKYGIQLEVLSKLGELSSKRGGQQAKKAIGKDNDLTAQESRFMKEANPGGYSPGG